MGKQVNFFITEQDELLFLEKVSELGYFVFKADRKGNIFEVNNDDIISPKEMQLFITYNGANILENSKFFQQTFSEIIQYSRCKRTENILEEGRIWAEFKYWNSQDELTTKSSRFNEMYNTLAKWLKKNMMLSVDKHFYIGKQAYQLYKEGKLIPKQNRYLIEF